MPVQNPSEVAPTPSLNADVPPTLLCPPQLAAR
jgi:hypothetical protein